MPIIVNETSHLLHIKDGKKILIPHCRERGELIVHPTIENVSFRNQVEYHKVNWTVSTKSGYRIMDTVGVRNANRLADMINSFCNEKGITINEIYPTDTVPTKGPAKVLFDHLVSIYIKWSTE